MEMGQIIINYFIYLFTIEAEERMSSWPNFLLHSEMVIQRHFLHSCQQALICIHCKDFTTHKINNH